MRDIVFRGKTPIDEFFNGGEWVKGFYTCFNGKEHRIYSGYSETDCGDYYPDWCNVTPETVGQCTGLHDTNGKSIFEGDIVNGLILHNLPIRAVVAFKDGAFGLDWQRGTVRVFTAFTSFCNTVFTVIGNIHDNPDLLEREGE